MASLDMPLEQSPRETAHLKCRGGGGGSKIKSFIQSSTADKTAT